MKHLALKLPASREPVISRTAAVVRHALLSLSSAGLPDTYRPPENLQYPMSNRARRLMRGRLNGW